jgi:hypothetical protein
MATKSAPATNVDPEKNKVIVFKYSENDPARFLGDYAAVIVSYALNNSNIWMKKFSSGPTVQEIFHPAKVRVEVETSTIIRFRVDEVDVEEARATLFFSDWDFAVVDSPAGLPQEI